VQLAVDTWCPHIATIVLLIWANRVHCRHAAQTPWCCCCANHQLGFCVPLIESLIVSASLLMLCGVGQL